MEDKRHTTWPSVSTIGQVLREKANAHRVPVSIPTSHHVPSLSLIPIAGKPWNFYQAFLKIDLGGSATLASRKKDNQVFSIKRHQGTIEEIRVLFENSHKNIVQCHDIYFIPNSIFLVEDCMDVSLSEVIACVQDLNERQIATICSEVSSGIKFLESLDMVHTEIKPRNVLLSLKGEVKIANFSHCKRKQPNQEECHARSLGYLAMEMMDRNVFVRAHLTGMDPALNHPDRWSISAKNFLHAASWAPLDEVARHAFLKNVTSCSGLVPHVRLALTTVKREWSCADLE